MSQILLEPAFHFLTQLRDNNNREWFNENKSTYQSVQKGVIQFAESLHEGISQQDEIETLNGKKSLHRIYRDVRFSKDKTPYSTHFGGSFRRATALRRGGYYYHLEPGNTFVIGGFWGPSAQDLLQIRKQIQQYPDPLRDILDSKAFKQHFGSLQGQQLKTKPKGFEADDPSVDLLRYKQFLIQHSFSDQEVMADDFDQKVVEYFGHMRPFFDYMSEILTTDLNGEPIV
ncbi:DUF2461 domain-containing protein [Reichenbachiella ulvae]|uniref:DUF2461 domain-containing protein n=1 Tax=Reichenbachiella ulvae TaxID=2980104 RepID=A0ABT3CXM4_9BACT|nr:DUF2461 domain-containing protein [Reichenbachiella ulvae]MCV9388450.1 DUF2461 domain-containing protein [Reichenbachiella ulvae]